MTLRLRWTDASLWRYSFYIPLFKAVELLKVSLHDDQYQWEVGGKAFHRSPKDYMMVTIRLLGPSIDRRIAGIKGCHRQPMFTG